MSTVVEVSPRRVTCVRVAGCTSAVGAMRSKYTPTVTEAVAEAVPSFRTTTPAVTPAPSATIDGARISWTATSTLTDNKKLAVIPGPAAEPGRTRPVLAGPSRAVTGLGGGVRLPSRVFDHALNSAGLEPRGAPFQAPRDMGSQTPAPSELPSVSYRSGRARSWPNSWAITPSGESSLIIVYRNTCTPSARSSWSPGCVGSPSYTFQEWDQIASVRFAWFSWPGPACTTTRWSITPSWSVSNEVKSTDGSAARTASSTR